MMYPHRGASPISRFAANRDPDSKFPFPAESGNGDSLFPESGRVGNRGFPPRFPAKSGIGGTGIGDFRVWLDLYIVLNRMYVKTVDSWTHSGCQCGALWYCGGTRVER
jgi:hypothetical protein